VAEYVEVADAMLRRTRELKKFFDLSYDYVGGLKPKPTTRKKIERVAGQFRNALFVLERFPKVRSVRL